MFYPPPPCTPLGREDGTFGTQDVKISPQKVERGVRGEGWGCKCASIAQLGASIGFGVVVLGEVKCFTQPLPAPPLGEGR